MADDLKRMTKGELLAFASDRGLDLNESLTKDEVIHAIRDSGMDVDDAPASATITMDDEDDELFNVGGGVREKVHPLSAAALAEADKEKPETQELDFGNEVYVYEGQRYGPGRVRVTAQPRVLESLEASVNRVQKAEAERVREQEELVRLSLEDQEERQARKRARANA